MPAGGTLTLYAAGLNNAGSNRNSIYLTFKVSTSGDELYLTDPSGRTVDAFNTGKLREGRRQRPGWHTLPTACILQTAAPIKAI